MLGIGTGGFRRESEGFGIPLPTTLKEKMGRFKENIMIAKQMWSGDGSPFVGKYYKLDEPLCSPMPLSKPHPPIIIAGSGEKLTLKWVARYGDGWNWHLGAHPKLAGYSERPYDWYQRRFERLGHLLDVLKKHCEREDRDFEDIEITLLSPIELSESAMTPEDVIEMCEEMAGLGVHHLVFDMPNDHEITPIEIIGEEIIPQVGSM